LKELAGQQTEGRFTFSAVVADNDKEKSAEPVLLEFGAQDGLAVRYCVEPRQGIVLARNKVLENASGDFIALIDDDEFPSQDWLLNLLKTCEEYQVDGVLGPVKRHFDCEPPDWIVKGNFYQRPVARTGSVVKWWEARSGNVLLRPRILKSVEGPFRPQFRSGEDLDFFRRMIEKGYRFVWCADAVVYEVVPPARWKPTYMLRKALLRGASARLQPSFGAASLGKSAVAVVLYTIALPLALIFGYHRFMALLVKLFDHLGKLLAFAGIDPIKGQYVTD